MSFKFFYGHMTFASHRCWTVFAKKVVFLAAEAWRRQFRRAVRFAAIKEGGGEILQYNRTGMDPYPLVGWTKVAFIVVYEGPQGEVYDDLEQVYDFVLASKNAAVGAGSTNVHLSVLQRFLNDCCAEREKGRRRGAVRCDDEHVG